MFLKTTKAYVELHLETFTGVHASILKPRIGVYNPTYIELILLIFTIIFYTGQM